MAADRVTLSDDLTGFVCTSPSVRLVQKNPVRSDAQCAGANLLSFGLSDWWGVICKRSRGVLSLSIRLLQSSPIRSMLY